MAKPCCDRLAAALRWLGRRAARRFPLVAEDLDRRDRTDTDER